MGIVFLKLGGSLLTDKRQAGERQHMDVIERLAAEIAELGANGLTCGWCWDTDRATWACAGRRYGAPRRALAGRVVGFAKTAGMARG